MNLIYHPLAERDLEEAFDHNQEIRPSLAKEFLAEFDRCVAKMADLFAIAG